MKWLLVVFSTSLGEQPKTILERPVETQQLCESAAMEVEIQLGDVDKTALVKVFAFCIRIAN